MFRSKKTLIHLWITSSMLLLGACNDATVIDPVATTEIDGAVYSRAAAAGVAPGVATNDTSILSTATLRVFWYEPSISYAQSGRNRVAVTPVWTVRNTQVLTVSSVSGMYVNLSAKTAGSTYVVGKVHSRVDSVKVTVTAPVIPQTPPTPPVTPPVTPPIATP